MLTSPCTKSNSCHQCSGLAQETLNEAALSSEVNSERDSQGLLNLLSPRLQASLPLLTPALLGPGCALSKLWAFKPQCLHISPAQLTQNLWAGAQAEVILKAPLVIQIYDQSWAPLAFHKPWDRAPDDLRL